MRLLVTGATGMLGTSLVPALRDGEHNVMATDINHLEGDVRCLDVRNLQDMIACSQSFNPHMLIHLAAETNLETCEINPDFAYSENFVGTQNACVVCRNLGIPLVYISTAGVFDGTKDEPYTEFDMPNPINVYGMSKWMGEKIVRETLPDHFIVRAGWMVGGGERDKKFVHKIIEQLDAGARTIHAVGDKIGTPTYAKTFSSVLTKLIGTRLFGTYHLACKGRASRYEVAAEMLKVLGRDEVTLEKVDSGFFSDTFFAPRPRSEEMRNYVLDLRSMNDMPLWQNAIAEYLSENFKHAFR